MRWVQLTCKPNDNKCPSVLFTKFQNCSISFKAIHFHTPQYLHDLLHWYTPVRTLRSANKNLLAVPSSRTILADRAFSRAAPTVWNALPPSVTSVSTFPSFKKALKIHLFQLAHDT